MEKQWAQILSSDIYIWQIPFSKIATCLYNGKKKITVAELLGLTKLTKIINIGCWYKEKNEILYIPIIINYWMPYSKEH